MKGIDINDLLGVLGLGLLSYGSALVYWPALFIVPGVVLMLFAVLSAWSSQD